jgi:hypothetical protein
MLVYVFLALLANGAARQAVLDGNFDRRVDGPFTDSIGSDNSTPWPRPMSFYSAFSGLVHIEQSIAVRCRLQQPANNVDEHILIEGTVEEDVVSSAGKILIPAGSRVVGSGFCDSEGNRILARGRWTFFVPDHQIRVEGVLWRAGAGEGLLGETAVGNTEEPQVKRAIFRDGTYLYVPAGTEFELKLSGNIAVDDLQSADSE